MLNRAVSLLLFLCCASFAVAQPLVLKNVNLVDVRKLSLLPQRVVVIEGDRIQTISELGGWRQQPGQVVVDAKGQYLIPGLIDAHVHHATDPEGSDNQALTLMRLRKLLRGGVTGVRDMGGDVRTLASLKRRAEIDSITSPDIYYSVILGGPGFFSDARTVSSARGRKPGETDWMRAIDAATDYDAVVLRAQGTGATGLKAYADLTAPQLQKLAAAARRHGMQIWSHAYHRSAVPSAVSAAGVQVISHAPYLAAELMPDYYSLHRGNTLPDESVLSASFEESAYAPLLDTLAQQGTMLDATLAVFELIQTENEQREITYRHAVMFTRMAQQRGITLVAGTDTASDIAGLPFPAVHYELELMVSDAGLTPAQALQTATWNGALALGIAKDYGSIEVGKVANLVLLQDNPLQDIRNTRRVAHVIKNGHFVFRGADPRLPFSMALQRRGKIWLSGQIGNLPGTLQLAGDSVEAQMEQAMRNIGSVLEDYDLGYDDIGKCTLMLADIADWSRASAVYQRFFNPPLPARSAFAAAGLAMGAKVEVECAVD